MAKRFNKAIKTPRLKNYQKRAASNCNTTRCANRYIHSLTDNAVRRVHGTEAEKKRFVKDVKKNLPPTRQTSKFLKKKDIILIMGREAYNDRKLHRNEATPNSRAEGSTQQRRNQARRRLFQDESPAPSPQFNHSPISLNDFLNDAMLVEEVVFDPEAAAAAFFNRIEEEDIEYVFEEPEEEIIVLVPVDSPPAVPIEDPPVADGQFAADDQPVADALYTDDQTVQPQATQFKPDGDLEEVLDDHINIIEEAMSPPDYRGHVLLEEE